MKKYIIICWGGSRHCGWSLGESNRFKMFDLFVASKLFPATAGLCTGPILQLHNIKVSPCVFYFENCWNFTANTICVRTQCEHTNKAHSKDTKHQQHDNQTGLWSSWQELRNLWLFFFFFYSFLVFLFLYSEKRLILEMFQNRMTEHLDMWM